MKRGDGKVGGTSVGQAKSLVASGVLVVGARGRDGDVISLSCEGDLWGRELGGPALG